MREGIHLSEAITGDGAAIFRYGLRLGLEGVVSKWIGSRYVSGRTGPAEEEPASEKK
jgi:ATP-dependent DNA ligase